MSRPRRPTNKRVMQMNSVKEKLGKLFSGVSSILAKRKQQAIASYESFVVAVADGRDIKLEALADALELAGKSDEDFAADVDLVLKRREWKALADSEAKWREEYDRLAKK